MRVAQQHETLQETCREEKLQRFPYVGRAMSLSSEIGSTWIKHSEAPLSLRYRRLHSKSNCGFASTGPKLPTDKWPVQSAIVIVECGKKLWSWPRDLLFTSCVA